MITRVMRLLRLFVSFFFQLAFVIISLNGSSYIKRQVSFIYALLIMVIRGRFECLSTDGRRLRPHVMFGFL